MISKRNMLILMMLCMIVILTACMKDIDSTEEDVPAAEETAALEAVEEYEEIIIDLSYDEGEGVYILQSNLQGEDFLLVEEGATIQLENGDNSTIYSFDFQSLIGSSHDQEGSAVASADIRNAEYIAVASGKIALVEESQGHSLYHSVNDTEKQIGRLSSEGISDLVVSPDRSKIAFREEGSLIIYNVNNQRLMKLETGPEEIMADFSQGVIFSPMAGYLTLLVQNENGVVGFKSFGADSGKLLHDVIYGGAPVWSSNDLYIAFLYRDSNTQQPSITVEGLQRPISDKIALFNRKTKKISYLAEFTSPTSIIGPPVWSQQDSGIIFTTGVDRLMDIHLYQLSNKNILSLSEEEALHTGSLIGLSDIQVLNNRVVYVLNLEDNKKALKLVDLSGRGVAVIEDVVPAVYVGPAGEREALYNIIAGDIFYKKGGSIYSIKDFDSRAIIKNKAPVVKFQYLEKNKLLAAYLQKEGGLEIVLARLE